MASRAKRKEKKEETKKMTVEAAAAAHLEIISERSTAKQCLRELLESVKSLTGKTNLTVTDLRQELKRWFEKGWATLSGEFIQITRAGRAKIKQIADQATAMPQPA